MAGEKQTTTRGVAGLALLGFLTKRRDPAKPYGKAQPHPGMATALHMQGLPRGGRGYPYYRLPITGRARARTRSKKAVFRIADRQGE